MQLPPHPEGGVQIGVSDILQWRDCATRMEFGMRRHKENGEAPESWSPANAYGSAVHRVIQLLDDDSTIEQAVDAAFREFKQWLEPSDLSLLTEDAEKYLAREQLGVRTLLNEGEISIPLFVHPVVGQVWFRARIDRLVQSIDQPWLLTHFDYKSSKWARSQKEVDEDIQLWAYNLGIMTWFLEQYPEFDDPEPGEEVQLQQVYDQLRYGQIDTRKGPQQRWEIRRWLIAAITAIIEDTEMKPSFNQWCPWCPLKMDCPVVQYQLTDWALTRIAALMPREPKTKKDGTPSKVLEPPKLDPDRLADYVELLPDVHRAGQVLAAFEETVKKLLKEMPDKRLRELGRAKKERKRRAFTTIAKRRIIDQIGLDSFLHLATVSIAAVERFFGEDKQMVEMVTEHAEEQGHYYVIVDSEGEEIA